MLFVNDRPDPPCINDLSTEDKNDILKAFATGSTIETISKRLDIPEYAITIFLDNRVDEIIALKDFYVKMDQSIVDAEIKDINEKAVKENDKDHTRY